jgi:membrane protein
MDADINHQERRRDARSPREIPALGWKDIAVRVYRGIGDDRIVAISGGVVFFALLAIFPGIAALVAVYGLLADPATAGQHVEALRGIVPAGGLEVISEQVQRLISQPTQRLGWATVAGLAISLWSANGGIKAIFDALNVVYHEREKRGFFALNTVSLVFTILAVIFSIVSIVVIAIIPNLLEYLRLSSMSELLLKVGRWPLLLAAVSFAIALVYRYGPSRDEPKWRWISPGSILASICWLILSIGFGWYAENFANYDKTYGSLGAVIAFMIWMWLSTIIVLLGAKLNAEMEHQTTADSTEGSARPMGQRGAHMADTIGESTS